MRFRPHDGVVVSLRNAGQRSRAEKQSGQVLDLAGFEAKVYNAFSGSDEEGLCEFSALVDMDALQRAEGGSPIPADDWKSLCRIVQNIVRAQSGVHFVYHDVRTNPKKFSHCSRYLCASRASNRIAEQNRRRNNHKILKYDCRGTLNCSILHGQREMFISVIHVDHDVVGVARLPPLPHDEEDSMEELLPTPKRARKGLKVREASPAYVADDAEEEESLESKRIKLAHTPTEQQMLPPHSPPAPPSVAPSPATSLPSTEMRLQMGSAAYPHAYLTHSASRALLVAPMPPEHAMPLYFSPHHSQQPGHQPNMLPLHASMPALPPHMMSPPVPFSSSHVSPAPPLLERPLSSMSGCTAEADRDTRLQEAEDLIPALLDIFRSRRALHPQLDDFIQSARRLVDAARMAEQSEHSERERQLTQDSTMQATHCLPHLTSSGLLMGDTSYVDQSPMPLDASLGDLDLGLTLDSWRMLRLMQ